MPDVTGQCVDIVLRRVRDPLGMAHSRADVRAVLTDAQRLVNLAVPGVLHRAIMTVQPERVLFDFGDLVDATAAVVPPAQIARVQRIVRTDGVDLTMVPWRSFGKADPRWIRRLGGTQKLWARLGRDLVICYPAVRQATTVSLLYVPLCAPLASDDDLLALRDDRTPAVLALAETILLGKRRHWASMKTAMATLRTELARLPMASDTGQAAWS